MSPTVLPLATIASLFLCSCAGPAFNRDWKQAVAEYKASSEKAPVAGPWSGRWLSDMNQHTGDLRCLVTPAKDSDNRCQFRYHATWAKFLSGGFKAEFPVYSDGAGGHVFDGDHDLGTFGKFRHKGRIGGNSFSATYESSSGDHGTFEMARP